MIFVRPECGFVGLKPARGMDVFCCVILKFWRLWLTIQGVLLVLLESWTAFPKPGARALQSGAENSDIDY